MSKKNKTAIHKNSERSVRISRILYYIVLISFIIPIIYIGVRMIIGAVIESETAIHTNPDYVLMLVECLLGLISIHIPTFLAKKLRFELPVILYIMFIVFLYCAIFLGEVRSFYYRVPFWDSILHSFSAMMLGVFGYMLISILNKNKKIALKLTPFFMAVFAFSFALSIGTLWEIYEFTFDGILGLNMQKFMTYDGEVLIGHEALSDTMKDLIIDAIGALVAAVLGYFFTKKDKYWFVTE